MFWESIEPNLTNRLKAAVDDAYAVFGKYRLSGTIVHCNCPVCMTAEVAAQLSRLPLAEISAPLLAQYTNSAHGYDREAIEPEFKHFLPRYLDLIAHCDIPSPIGLESCLARLGQADYRANWPGDEAAVIDAFFTAFLEACIGQIGLTEWPVGMRLELDLGEVLTMIVRAGGDLDAAFETLDGASDPAAATHMAAMRGDLTVRDGLTVLDQAFLSDHPDAAQAIGAFLIRDSVTERIGEAITLLDNPDYDDVLDQGLLF